VDHRVIARTASAPEPETDSGGEEQQTADRLDYPLTDAAADERLIAG
jgi:hypothetical protein